MMSVVVPLYNESSSLESLYKSISEVMSKIKMKFEVIFVNDGSTDGSQEVIEKLFSKYPDHVIGIKMRRNFGKACALTAGFQRARGDLILMIDADLQDDPTETPKFLAKLDEGYDVVCGWKQNRMDSFVKNKTSRFFNFTIKILSNAKLHDNNCGFKLFKAEAAKSLDLYGSMHRYITPLVEANGYTVTEVAIRHRQRKFGKSKFGTSRFFHGGFDFLSVLYMTRFRYRPMHFFGYTGLVSFFVGLAIALYLTLYKYIGHHSIGTRPLLFLSMLLMIVGVQIFMSGVIGEQFLLNSKNRSSVYGISKILAKDQNNE